MENRQAKLRVAFLVLLDGKLYGSAEHLGVEYLAAVLRRDGHAVRIDIVDATAACDRTGIGVQQMLSWEPDIVGFTTFDAVMPDIIACARIIKEHRKDVHIVLGGASATVWDREMLSDNCCIDFIVRGEAEKTLPELVHRVATAQSLAGCAGVSYRDSTGIHRNADRALIQDLESLPMPTRDMLVNNQTAFARISTVRGCFGHCSFCAERLHSEYEGRMFFRSRSASDVVREIEQIERDYGINAFVFVDPSAEDPGPRGKRRLQEFAETILDRDLEIYFLMHFRAESMSEDDRDLLNLLVRAGLEVVEVGIESGNREDLALYNKRATLEENKKALVLLRSLGVYVMTGFIMFNPYSTFSRIRENIEFIRVNKLGHKLEFLVSRLAVYSGSSIAGTLRKDGLLTTRYSYDSGIYCYSHLEPRIGHMAAQVGGLLKEYQLEIEWLDLSLGLFIRRVARKFGQQIAKELAEFEQDVDRIRLAMNKNNCDFMCRCIDLAESGWDSGKYAELIVKYIQPYVSEQIARIRSRWFRFRAAATRKGVLLQEIIGRRRNGTRGGRTHEVRADQLRKDQAFASSFQQRQRGI